MGPEHPTVEHPITEEEIRRNWDSFDVTRQYGDYMEPQPLGTEEVLRRGMAFHVMQAIPPKHRDRVKLIRYVVGDGTVLLGWLYMPKRLKRGMLKPRPRVLWKWFISDCRKEGKPIPVRHRFNRREQYGSWIAPLPIEDEEQMTDLIEEMVAFNIPKRYRNLVLRLRYKPNDKEIVMGWLYTPKKMQPGFLPPKMSTLVNWYRSSLNNGGKDEDVLGV